MKTFAIRTLASLQLLAALAGAAEVSVHVLDPHQAPIAGSTISLISRTGDDSRSLTADASGSCSFQGVAAGEYLILAEAPGFDASGPQTVVLNGEDVTRQTIVLGIAQVRSSVTVTASGTAQS